MISLFKYYRYTVSNFFIHLSLKEFFGLLLGGVMICCILVLLVECMLNALHPLLAEFQSIVFNSGPQLAALCIIMSRLIGTDEGWFGTVYGGATVFSSLPLGDRQIFRIHVFVSILKKCGWVLASIIITLLIVLELRRPWTRQYSTTVCMVMLWGITAAMILTAAGIARYVLAGAVSWNNKFLLRMLRGAEILSAGIFFLALVLIVIAATPPEGVWWNTEGAVASWILLPAVCAGLYYAAERLFLQYSARVRHYFETERDSYPDASLPLFVQRAIEKTSSSLVQSVLRLSLAARSMGFTKAHSLVIVVLHLSAVMLLGATVFSQDASVMVAAVCSIAMVYIFFSAVRVSLPTLYRFASVLPLSPQRVRSVYLKSGLWLALPPFALLVMVTPLLGLDGMSMIAVLGILAGVLGILRLTIALCMPESLLMADVLFCMWAMGLAMLFPVFPLLPLIGAAASIWYYRRKLVQVWNAAA